MKKRVTKRNLPDRVNLKRMKINYYYKTIIMYYKKRRSDTNFMQAKFTFSNHAWK